ncbi:hypothetical protein [Crateriforma spongiae]|uniref:hypothetical protein n=1 Tax=Crateriforma spongiae TaxID=2724528 RepID=UPI0039B05E7C
MDREFSRAEFADEFVRQFAELQKRATSIYDPIVSSIVESGCTEKQFIESTLDGLLGFAGTDEGRDLFRSLCRYYWGIDQEATAFHVLAYRDMCEPERDDLDTEA